MKPRQKRWVFSITQLEKYTTQNWNEPAAETIHISASRITHQIHCVMHKATTCSRSARQRKSDRTVNR
jgi:hypothetical protein